MAELSISIFERNNCVSTCDDGVVPDLPLPAGQWLWLDVSGEIDAETRTILIERLGLSALASIEDAIFDNADDTALEALSRLNRVLRRLRRVLSYQAVVFERLQRRVQEKVVPFDKHETTDLFENMDRLATLCQLNQELAVDLLNTHLGMMSHLLNVVMRVLTVATIVFLPLGIIAGVYGMNFENMPELAWQYGYFAVLGLMGAVVVGLVLFFRFKRWL